MTKLEELRQKYIGQKRELENLIVDCERGMIKQERCKHVWDNGALIAAEEDGRDLSEYDATCELCGIRYSEIH